MINWDTNPEYKEKLEKLLASGKTQVQIANIMSTTFSLPFTRNSVKNKIAAMKEEADKFANEERVRKLTTEEKLRYELKDKNKLVKSLTKRIISQEEIFSLFADEAFTSRRKVKITKKEKSSGLPKRDCIPVLSDVQAGSWIKKEIISVNQYDQETFAERLNMWTNAVIQEAIDYSKSHKICSLRVAIDGDMLEGHDIYNGQPYVLDKLAIEQLYIVTCAFEKAFVTIIEAITDEIGSIPISFYCVVGNHGLIGGRKTSGTGVLGLNFDYGFYMWLKKLLVEMRGIPINFHINKPKACLFESMGQIFCMVHGDEVRGWSGIPFYGLDKFEGKNIKYLDILYKNIILAHHHQQCMFPSGRGKRFINGCWTGPGDLCSQLRLYSPPEQLMLWNSRKFGVTDVKNIALIDHTKLEDFRPNIYDRGLT